MSGKGRFSKKVHAKGKVQAKGESNNASHTNKKSILMMKTTMLDWQSRHLTIKLLQST